MYISKVKPNHRHWSYWWRRRLSFRSFTVAEGVVRRWSDFFKNLWPLKNCDNGDREMNISTVMAQSDKKVWSQHQTEGDLYKHTHAHTRAILTSVLHWWHLLRQLETSGEAWSHMNGSVPLRAAAGSGSGSQEAAGSRARASRCRGRGLLLLRCYFVLSCSGGRRLLLEGRVPAGGRLRRALLHVVALLGSVEGQPPEERQLIGGHWLGRRLGICAVKSCSSHLYLFAGSWLAVGDAFWRPVGRFAAFFPRFLTCGLRLLSDFSCCYGNVCLL